MSQVMSFFLVAVAVGIVIVHFWYMVGNLYLANTSTIEGDYERGRWFIKLVWVSIVGMGLGSLIAIVVVFLV